MTKMTRKELMEILRNRIERYEKDWNNLRMLGDQRGMDLVDGRQKEARDLLWMLEDVELVEEETEEREMKQAWYQEEKKLYGCNGPVIAYDSDTEKHMGTFNTYDDFRSAFPGAEIVGHEATDQGCIIYC